MLVRNLHYKWAIDKWQETGGVSVNGDVKINMHCENLQVQFGKQRDLDNFSSWLAKINLDIQNLSRSSILTRANAL